jgi:hypothetical protein
MKRMIFQALYETAGTLSVMIQNSSLAATWAAVLVNSMPILHI